MPDKTPTLLNIGAVNGPDPAPPEDESERDEWLQGDIELQEKKADDAKERSDKAHAFYTGQDDDERTAKPERVATHLPAKSAHKASAHKASDK